MCAHVCACVGVVWVWVGVGVWVWVGVGVCRCVCVCVHVCVHVHVCVCALHISCSECWCMPQLVGIPIALVVKCALRATHYMFLHPLLPSSPLPLPRPCPGVVLQGGPSDT